jgi:hypothetical protein
MSFIQKTDWKKLATEIWGIAFASVFLGSVFLSAMPVMADAGSAALKASEPTANAPSLFKQYCYECHADGVGKGNVALDELLATQVPGEHAQWEKAGKRSP